MDEKLLLKLQLRDFYEEYAAALDAEELEAWIEYFDEGARYEVTSRENFEQGLPYATIFCDGLPMIRDRVTSIREALIYEVRTLRRFLSSLRITGIDGDTITATANFLVTECIAEAKADMAMVGTYVDVLRRTGDGFLIKRRQCVVDNYWLPRSVIIPV